MAKGEKKSAMSLNSLLNLCYKKHADLNVLSRTHRTLSLSNWSYHEIVKRCFDFRQTSIEIYQLNLTHQNVLLNVQPLFLHQRKCKIEKGWRKHEINQNFGLVQSSFPPNPFNPSYRNLIETNPIPAHHKFLKYCRSFCSPLHRLISVIC